MSGKNTRRELLQIRGRAGGPSGGALMPSALWCAELWRLLWECVRLLVHPYRSL